MISKIIFFLYKIYLIKKKPQLLGNEQIKYGKYDIFGCPWPLYPARWSGRIANGTGLFCWSFDGRVYQRRRFMWYF